ncbi:helix-turn-helix transcriptional regulator [Spongiibacter sp.]|uniref:helix-turn-helix transcriptional regulator n=1 Tax=Spongiibacter sp. TaxID=2024860 RepID=UPI000C3E64B3|nr:helix-turn-helix transcriptional regulator [Spongiibacter sp.]MBU71299.1 hypothetical protein [Spongiibacter sp.]|tara:strand:+ start:244 stop:942 length:699 start_codon:yes stop_codon:yes gene_type:complete
MSISIAEKIEKIRVESGLTQPEFADEVGISINTYKAILKRGSSPRFEVVEKIAKRWPKYSLWLLTGNAEPENQQYFPGHSFGDTGKAVYHVVDRVDARFMDRCVVKSEAIDRLIFIQNSEDEYDLGAILLVDNQIMYRISARENDSGIVWVSTGNMSFVSEGGGRLALSAFRRWLVEKNKDLIRSAEYMQLESDQIEGIWRNLHLAGRLLRPVESQCLKQRFEEWVEGGQYS